MKIKIIIAFMLVLSSYNYNQERIGIKVFSQYSFISPTDLNKFLADKQNKYSITTEHPDYLSGYEAKQLQLEKPENIESQISYGLEMYYRINNILTFGFGLKYFYNDNVSYDYVNGIGRGDPPVKFGWSKYTLEYSNYSIPLSLRFCYPIIINHELFIILGTQLNICSFKYNHDFTYYNQARSFDDETINANGFTFGYQIGVGYNLKLFKNITFFVEGSYNKIEITELKSSNNINLKLTKHKFGSDMYYDIKTRSFSGEIEKNLNLDFSGFAILGGINFHLF